MQLAQTKELDINISFGYRVLHVIEQVSTLLPKFKEHWLINDSTC